MGLVVGGCLVETTAVELLNRITAFISDVAKVLPVDEFTVKRTVPELADTTTIAPPSLATHPSCPELKSTFHQVYVVEEPEPAIGAVCELLIIFPLAPLTWLPNCVPPADCLTFTPFEEATII